MVGILETLIGAAAAITGGYLAVRWQARHATEVAQRIRREERREDGLFALRAKVNDVSGRIDASYRSVECSPSLSPWPEVYTAAAELREMWQMELSGKIPDKAIVSKYLEFDGRVRDCVPWAYPPPPRKGDDPAVAAKAFVQALGTALARLGELRAELEQQIDALLHL